MAEHPTLIGWARITGSVTVNASGYGRVYGRHYGKSAGGSSSAGFWLISTQEHEELASYRTKFVDGLPTFRLSLPPPGRTGRGLGEQEVSLRLSNIHTGDTTVAPTVSYIKSTQEIRGQFAEVGIRQAGVGNIAYLAGRVKSVNKLDRLQAEITVASEDAKLRNLKVPKRKVRDLFPSALTDGVTAQDPCVVWPFGKMYTAELSCCMAANSVRVLANMSNVGDRFHYEDLTNIANTVIAAGDFLEYDVLWETADAFIAMDLECTDGTRLKTTNPNDQNGFAATPTTDLSSKTINMFYRRRIPLASLAGKTVSKFMLACESNGNGQKGGSIGQAVIVNSDGVVLREIITRNQASFTSVMAYSSDVNTTSMTVTKNNTYRYGPIKNIDNATTVTAVYRLPQGGVVDSSEYTIITLFGLKFVQFASSQIDANGNPARILVDLDTTAYNNNPITVALGLINDVADGAGEVTIGFATAAATMAGLGITVGQGLDHQVELGQVLDDLAYMGTYYFRVLDGSTFKVSVAVDTDAAHAAAPIALEAPATNRSVSLGIDNCEVLERNDGGSLDEFVIRREARGFLYRGIADAATPSWLLGTERSRSGDGVDGDIYDFPYIIDGTVLDKVLDYEWRQEIAYGDRLRLEITRQQHAVQLAVGQKVTVSVEDMFISGVLYLLRGLEISEQGAFVADLSSYPSYTYTPGTKIRIDSKANRDTDYTRTFPGPPTNLTQGTATIRPATTGEVEVLIPFTATPPAVNFTALLFRLHARAGSVIDPDVIAERLKPASVNSPVTVRFSTWGGNLYAVRCYTINSNNAVAYQESVLYAELNVTAPVGSTPPSTVTWISITQTAAYVIQCRANPVPETDVNAYLLYRANVDNSAQGVVIYTGESPQYDDTSFSEANSGQQKFYWWKARRSSGLLSAAFSQVRSVTISAPETPPPTVITRTYTLGFADVSTTESTLLAFVVPTGTSKVVITVGGFADRTGDGTSSITLRVRRASNQLLISTAVVSNFTSAGQGFNFTGTDPSPPVSQNVTYNFTGVITSGIFSNANVSTVTITVNIHSV